MYGYGLTQWTALCICGVVGMVASLTIAQAAHTDYTNNNNNNHNNNKQQHHERYSKIDERNTQTLRNELNVHPDGKYHYTYATSNGIAAEESGHGGIAVQGSSSYTSPEGIQIKTSYVADDMGYHAVGDHIPKIPDYILRSLEYIRTHPYQIRDIHSGKTKTLSPDHVAFKAFTRNALRSAPPASQTAQTPTQLRQRYNQQQQQQLNKSSQQRFSRGALKSDV